MNGRSQVPVALISAPVVISVGFSPAGSGRRCTRKPSPSRATDRTCTGRSTCNPNRFSYCAK
nr:hypothetical protein ISGA_11675 [Gordonia sp. NB41Y]